MRQKLISIALLFVLMTSCEKELEVRDFPILTTLNPTEIDETGVTLRGELIRQGINKTSSYGFIWSVGEPNINTSNKIILGNDLPEGVFEARINASLAKGFKYKIRAFATYDNKTVYGNRVSMLSKGSRKSLWELELEGVKMGRYNSTPYGWSDGDNGYVIFQNSKVYRFNPVSKRFASVANFPESGNSGSQFSAAAVDNVQYVFSDSGNKLYRLKDGIWSVAADTPFYYGYFSGYYHSYATANELFLLSSTQSYSYKLVGGLWQPRTEMPAVYYSIAGTDLKGFAYMMDSKKNIKKYDPQSDTWEEITQYPGNFPVESMHYIRDRGEILAFSHENSIYFGFIYGDTEAHKPGEIWGFNLTTKLWKKIESCPVNLDRSETFHFSLKGKLYIGYSNSNDYTIYSLDKSKL